MLPSLTASYELTSAWLNSNQGVVSIGLFGGTLTLGWVSGIFSALRRKPKFKLNLIHGPTFCCTYLTGGTHAGHKVHRTGLALYLSVANIGSAPSSINGIAVGYHWHLRPFSRHWLKYKIGWFWLSNQSVALEDFHVRIGENIKVYPFLTQTNFMSPAKVSTFLDVGRSTNGVVYFEQEDSWGGCFPSIHDERVRVKVCVQDVFRRRHTATFDVPAVSLEQARTYNPSFGKTAVELRGEKTPSDSGN